MSKPLISAEKCLLLHDDNNELKNQCHQLPQAVTISIPKKSLWKFTKLCLIGCVFLSIFYYFFIATDYSEAFQNAIVFGGQGINYGQYREMNARDSQNEPHKHILLYSDFYDRDRNWYLGTNYVDDAYFEQLNCPQKRCIITSNRTLLSGGIRSFDALLFFAHDKWDIPEFPPNALRRLEQHYVVGMLESPLHTFRRFGNDSGMFNWTMTYGFNSDVFWPYGYFIDRVTKNVIAPAKQPIWRQLDTDHFNRSFFRNESLLKLISKKSKMAAWFTSNCVQTPSRRQAVAISMRKFIKVDVYGKCGRNKCPISKHTECQKMLERDYKFYLAFENSLCTDYITEKVFSNMQYHIIPVVYNGADNALFLPPGSYLNVRDYSTIKELTDHMQYLANNPSEYIKYFWWKEFYTVRAGYNFCDLCVKLHEENVEQRRQNYYDLDEWYGSNSCIPTKDIPLE